MTSYMHLLEPAQSFFVSFMVSDCYKKEKAFTTGEHKYGAALFQVGQALNIVGPLVGKIFQNYKYLPFISSSCASIAAIGFIGLSALCASESRNLHWLMVASTINTVGSKAKKRINAISQQYLGRTYLDRDKKLLDENVPPLSMKTASLINKHAGTALQITSITVNIVSLAFFGGGVIAGAALAGQAISHISRFNILPPQVDYFLEKCSKGMQYIGSALQPSYIGRTFAIIAFACHFFETLSDKAEAYIDHLLCRRWKNAPVPSLLETMRPKQNETLTTVNGEIKDYTFDNSFGNRDNPNRLHIDPSHIGRSKNMKLPDDLTKDIKNVNFETLLVEWDSLNWFDPDTCKATLTCLKRKLKDDNQFKRYAIDNGFYIHPEESRKPCNDRIDWTKFSDQQVINWTRDRLEGFMKGMTGQRKLEGNSGDIETMRTNTKIIINQLVKLDPISKQDLLMDIAISCGLYCAEGLRSELPKIIETFIMLNVNCGSIQQKLDIALKRFRKGKIEEGVNHMQQALKMATGDVHNADALRQIVTRGFELESFEFSEVAMTSFITIYQEALLNYQTRASLWNGNIQVMKSNGDPSNDYIRRYDSKLIYDTFVDLINDGTINKDEIESFWKEYVKNRKDLSDNAQEDLQEHITNPPYESVLGRAGIWKSDDSPITNKNVGKLNPRLIMAMLVEMGYLTTTAVFDQPRSFF